MLGLRQRLVFNLRSPASVFENFFLFSRHLDPCPSVLSCCWLGDRKGIRPVKKLEWWDAGVAICLERGAGLHMAQLMPLPLTISCSSKILIGFYLSCTGSPG